ncbi:MAG: hypothetical protein H6835_02780 [Planctomycetes bacterium]|nr:hypothetical protein [Planctomycetota bacterium]
MQIAAIAGPSTPLIDAVLAGVRRAAEVRGFGWTDTPDDTTDAFVTTARIHEPLSWRHSPLFIGRKRYNLTKKPANYAFVQVPMAELHQLLQRLEAALAQPAPGPEHFDFPGLSTNGWQVLADQGGRGGTMMSLGRLLQAQTKSLRVVMVVGDDRPVAAHLFDLAGAYPRIDAADPERFHDELLLRIATHLSTREITNHRVDAAPIPAAVWRAAAAPKAMLHVSRELGARRFFTRMVRIADLVDVPAITDAVAKQYSEGCFGTHEPTIHAQVVTVTGSDHPVEKASIGENDLAVIQGVRTDGTGVLVRSVEGLSNDPPSSEAVEFELIDTVLPRVVPHPSFGIDDAVPVVRSKLHGHRGVIAYDPATVEYVPLDEPFFHYLVSCSTEAQAQGIVAAFSRSEALRNPADPRTVVFTVLPGHGLMMAEKWVPGTRPFEVLLRAMDEQRVEIANGVPQGPMSFRRDGDRMVLQLRDGVVHQGDGLRPAQVRDFDYSTDYSTAGSETACPESGTGAPRGAGAAD